MTSDKIIHLPRLEGGEMPPLETSRHKAFVRGWAIATLLVTAAYIAWRLTSTINLGVWWVAVPLIVAEAHNAFAFGLFTLALWDLDARPKLRAPRHNRSVAILIPTYNEPASVLLPSIAAAVSIDPPHETWVLDDGRREWVRELAEHLGARYLTRPNNEHAKAGNLNHALEVVDAEIIGVLDADYVVSPGFLVNTLGYFDDDRVAVVQMPQDFYNLDSFEHEGETDDGPVYNEERVFYRALAPAKNRWHAAFWCGTCALVRTEALRDAGGVATETVTEDIHTTFRLMQKGWTTVYHNEVLARGLAPTDAHQYMLQRHRWALGAMQVLRIDNPFTTPGLTFGQRLAFATTLFGWFDSWRAFAFVTMPVLVLATGASPIDAPGYLYGPFFLVTLGMQFIGLRLLARGHYPPTLSVLFEMLRLPAVLPATLHLVGFGGRAGFQVTPKGRTGGERRHAPVPPLLTILGAASVVSMLWFAATAAGLTWMTYEQWPAVLGSLIFACVNLGFIVWAVRRIRRPQFAGERRDGYRFDVVLEGEVGGLEGEVVDVSVTGARVLLDASPGLDQGDEATLVLRMPAGGRELLRATVRRVRTLEDGRIDLGFEFIEGQDRAIGRMAVELFGGSVPSDSNGWERVAA